MKIREYFDDGSRVTKISVMAFIIFGSLDLMRVSAALHLLRALQLSKSIRKSPRGVVVGILDLPRGMGSNPTEALV